jgi:hypothetical protein
MSDPNPAPPENLTLSQKKFVEASEHVQRLIRQVLGEERQVMHLATRPNIHQKILDQVKSVIR